MIQRHPNSLAALASAAALSVAAVSAAQADLRFDVGQVVSTQLLQRLTNPARTVYRVGIVNVGAATGILITHAGSPAKAEFVRGADNFLWAQAAEQMAMPNGGIQLRFLVERVKIDEGSCPTMSEELESFFVELEKALSAPLSVSKRSPDKYQALGRDGNAEIFIDGTAYVIQLITSDSAVTVTPDAWSDTALHRAAGALHSKISGCSSFATKSVEEHYF